MPPGGGPSGGGPGQDLSARGMGRSGGAEVYTVALETPSAPLALVAASVVMGRSGSASGPAGLLVVLSNQGEAEVSVDWDRSTIRLGAGSSKAWPATAAFAGANAAIGTTKIGGKERLVEYIVGADKVAFDLMNGLLRPEPMRAGSIRLRLVYTVSGTEDARAMVIDFTQSPGR